MKLDQETAEAIVRLTHVADFQKFLTWFDNVHATYIQGAINGVDENYSSDVLRGRAQGLSIMKQEIEKAPELISRIQKIS